jgi:hypothetical protein
VAQDPAVLIRTSGLHGVFIGAHAIAEGALTRRQLREGPFVRVLHGVYADPSLPRDHLLKCRAAALLMPQQAVLAARSAAAVWGAPAPDYGEPVTVVLPPDVRWTGPRDVRVHRAALGPRKARVLGEHLLRVTEPVRTAWDVAALEPVGRAVGVLDAMTRGGLVTVPELKRRLSAKAGAWGSRRARRAFELVDPRSESPPESWIRVACALAGLPAPVPQFEVRVDGLFLGRVDLAWPVARLIVEYEGAYHFDGLQIVRDDERIRRLVAAGWRVLRVAAHDLRQMDDVVRRIGTALEVDVVA